MLPIKEALKKRNQELREKYQELGISFFKRGDYLVAVKDLSQENYEKYLSYGAEIQRYAPSELSEIIKTPNENQDEVSEWVFYIDIVKKSTKELICNIKFDFDVDESESGEYIGDFANGGERVRILANYTDNAMHGLFRSWDEKGRVKFESTFGMGAKHGIALKYSNGEIVEALNYEGGYLHGTNYICLLKRGENGVEKHYLEVKHNYGDLIERKSITELGAISKMNERREAFKRA